MRKKKWSKKKLDVFFDDGNMAIGLIEDGFPFTDDELSRINKELNDEDEGMSDSDLCDMIEEIAYSHFDKVIYTAIIHNEYCDNDVTPIGSFYSKVDAAYAIINHIGLEDYTITAREMISNLIDNGYYYDFDENPASYYVVENKLSCREF